MHCDIIDLSRAWNYHNSIDMGEDFVISDLNLVK